MGRRFEEVGVGVGWVAFRNAGWMSRSGGGCGKKGNPLEICGRAEENRSASFAADVAVGENNGGGRATSLKYALGGHAGESVSVAGLKSHVAGIPSMLRPLMRSFGMEIDDGFLVGSFGGGVGGLSTIGSSESELESESQSDWVLSGRSSNPKSKSARSPQHASFPS